MIRKRKNNGIVLKYYTVIGWNNRKEYTSLFKKFIKLFNDFLAKESIDIIEKFELNYATKKYSLEDFNAKEEIVDAVGNNAADSVSVIYGNNALNMSKKENEKHLLDLIIHFKEEVSEELILKLTELVNNIFSTTYGYGFDLEKNQEIISENFSKKKHYLVYLSNLILLR